MSRPVKHAPAAGSAGPQPCPNPITAGYYRMWRDVATTKPDDFGTNAQRLSDVPPEIDIVAVFATKPADDPRFWEALRDDYLPALRAQGTEVVFTLFIEEFSEADVEDTPEGYDAYAQRLVDLYIGEYGVDGLDIDCERDLEGIELERAVGTIRALARHLGPRSDGGYLIYDTNMTGDHPLFRRTHDCFDFVWLQAYGRAVSSLDTDWATFAPHISSAQFAVGVSFYEEHDTHNVWGDALEPFETSRAAAYARWQPEGGQKGGFFAYAIDRDGVPQGDDAIRATDFGWMKRLAELSKNPADLS